MIEDGVVTSKMCGHHTLDMVSRTNSVLLKFTSDGSGDGFGFYAFYSTTTYDIIEVG